MISIQLCQLRNKTESINFTNNGHVKFASVITVNNVIDIFTRFNNNSINKISKTKDFIVKGN